MIAKKNSLTPISQSGHLQAHFFQRALIEAGISDLSDAKINHYTGECYHPKIGLTPIVFPRSLVNLAFSLRKEKNQTYFFSGLITNDRDWIRSYPNVRNSIRGRDPASKYTYDESYLCEMGRTMFALSPPGNCPWSYRFFEAIMCAAIPVIGDLDRDIYSSSFSYFRDSHLKFYSYTMVDENYKTFLRNHTLS